MRSMEQLDISKNVPHSLSYTYTLYNSLCLLHGLQSIYPSNHRSIHRSIHRLIDWCIDRWIDGSMVWWFDGSIDWRPCRRQRELERVCVWDRKWEFCHYRWQVNTFWYIVHGSQCKYKRKSWSLFYSFLWTCRETAKSKALEIVYRTYARALKGW